MAGPRAYKLVTPLGDTELLFYRMRAIESLSGINEFQLECFSENGNIVVDDILAQNVHVEMLVKGDAKRFFSGFVTRFAQGGKHRRFHVYHATIHTWNWFLTRTADCRIFQEKTVPDIIKEVFGDHATADFEDALTATYPTREYCVQYRETDYNFVSRLMEEEGIYTFFKYDGNQNKLVLADSLSAHSPFPDYANIPFVKPSGVARTEKEHISRWLFEREVKPGKFALTDYDFKKPSVKLDAKTLIARGHKHADYEMFDYPGEYFEKSDGDTYVKTRLDELHSGYELVEGSANARGIAVGSLFTLTDHKLREDQNKEYLVTRTELSCQAEGFESDSQQGATFDCNFVALSSEYTFRPKRISPRPIVKGPQTAVVVGPAGDEIYTDEYGRVKVQFFWDRLGKNDENSSCWMRVSHPWAGKNWGMIAIPRIGQEVIVECLEGDPDRPIITGRVYNANQMPPYDLPANKTQTGIKTRSSKGGGTANFNEIRFEDKMGSEQLFIHAEKNQDIEVENDETHWVGHDRKKTIDHDETTEVKNNRTETVGVNEKIDIGANRTETVGANEKISIGANRIESVSANESITIGASRTTTIGAADSLSISATQTTTIGAAQTITVGASYTLTAGAPITMTTGAMASLTAAAMINMTAGAMINLTAGAAINLTAPAGVNLLGGTTINGLTSSESWLSGMKYGVTGLNTEAKGVDVSVVGVAVGTVGAKAENVGFDNKTKAMEKLEAGLQLINPGARIIQAGIALTKAGLKVFS